MISTNWAANGGGLTSLDVGGSRHDLALISLMEAMQGNGGEWDSASVTVDHLPIFQVERILADNPQRRIWRHVQGFVA
ncbi:MAG UNVERIFIED_CONTAM: hypothetical protein LVT10_20290 [Anaerolineae bacterium]